MTQPRTKEWVVEPGLTATTNHAVRALRSPVGMPSSCLQRSDTADPPAIAQTDSIATGGWPRRLVLTIMGRGFFVLPRHRS